jgi:hypothetical protein
LKQNILATRDGAAVAVWFVRFFPSFSFAYGIIGLTNKKIFATVAGKKVVPDTYSLDVGNILFLYYKLKLEEIFCIFVWKDWFTCYSYY